MKIRLWIGISTAFDKYTQELNEYLFIQLLIQLFIEGGHFQKPCTPGDAWQKCAKRDRNSEVWQELCHGWQNYVARVAFWDMD